MIQFLLGDTLALARSASRWIAYEDPARIAVERFTEAGVTAVGVPPKRVLADQSRDGMLVEELTRPLHDCSTEQFKCVYYWARVFAIPRTRLSPDAKFSVAGASLRVEDCLRGDGEVCQVALISADCQSISGKDACEEVAGGRNQSKEPGPIVYFIYNEDIGVTAWGVTDTPASAKEDRVRIASQMFLQGSRGLLLLP